MEEGLKTKWTTYLFKFKISIEGAGDIRYHVAKVTAVECEPLNEEGPTRPHLVPHEGRAWRVAADHHDHVQIVLATNVGLVPSH